MRKSLAAGILLLLCLCCALASASWAQVLGGGTIQGTVTDSTGAVVPGATVNVRNLDTNAVMTATTDTAGLFVFPVVHVGNYEVKVEKTGFATTVLGNVNVVVGSKVDLPLVFRVAGSKEQVTVTDETPLIETQRTATATYLNEATVNSIPVNGRNFLGIALLTPGVIKDPARGGDLSFAGQRGTLNSLTVDGADDNQAFYGQTAGRTGQASKPYQFSQDSVQEFQVATNGYSAEVGRAGGGVINVVTKSGTNQFHGGAFEYYRDQSMNAYDPIQKQTFYINPSNAGKELAAHKPKYHYNQFGGTLGGPIWKDRAFFFFAADSQRNTSPIITNSTSSVTLSSNATTAALQQTAINYLSPLAGNYSLVNNQDTYLLKGDAYLNKANQVSVRWNHQSFTAGNQENGSASSALSHTGNSFVYTDTITGSLTSTLSSRTINQFRFNYLKDREYGKANANGPEIAVTDGSYAMSVGRNNYSPRETTVHQYEWADNITYALGRNTLKAGADLVWIKVYNYFPGYLFGSYTFNSLADLGCVLSGETASYTPTGCTSAASASWYYQQAFTNLGGTQTTGPTTHPDVFEPAFFVQDDLRLTKNLTINAGVRWDQQQVKQSGITNATALLDGYNTGSQPIGGHQWGPRLGFAYTPLSNNKLVVRGGFGWFYGLTNSMFLGTSHSNNGVNIGTVKYTANQITGLISTPYNGSTFGTLAAAPTGTTVTPTLYVMDQGFRNPRVQQANFNVEYALAKDLSVSVGYLSVQGKYLQRTADQNLAWDPTNYTLTTYASAGNSSTAGTVNQAYGYVKYYGARPYASFQRIALFQSNSKSEYNGLVVELKKRMSHRFMAQLAYTYSIAHDDNPDATAVVNGSDDSKQAMYPTTPRSDWGFSGADLRHRLTLGYSYDANYHVKGILGAVVNGWSTSGLLTAQSGYAYSAMLTGYNLLNTGNTANLRVPGSVRNSYRMPATWSFDPRVARDINLYKESVKLNIFAEAFNLFNHFNVTSVKTAEYAWKTINNGSGSTFNGYLLQNPTNAATGYFGLPSGTSGQRILQLGARIKF